MDNRSGSGNFKFYNAQAYKADFDLDASVNQETDFEQEDEEVEFGKNIDYAEYCYDVLNVAIDINLRYGDTKRHFDCVLNNLHELLRRKMVFNRKDALGIQFFEMLTQKSLVLQPLAKMSLSCQQHLITKELKLSPEPSIFDTTSLLIQIYKQFDQLLESEKSYIRAYKHFWIITDGENFATQDIKKLIEILTKFKNAGIRLQTLYFPKTQEDSSNILTFEKCVNYVFNNPNKLQLEILTSKLGQPKWLPGDVVKIKDAAVVGRWMERFKGNFNTSQKHVPFHFTPNFRIAVSICLYVRDRRYLEAKKYYDIGTPSNPELHRVISKFEYLDNKTKQPLSSDELINTREVGFEQIPFTKEENAALRLLYYKGLRLIGFKVKSKFALHHQFKPGHLVVADDFAVPGSTAVLRSLIKNMLELGYVALAWFTGSRCSTPRLVALVPTLETYDEVGQRHPSGLFLSPLAFKNDIRSVPIPPLPESTEIPIDHGAAVGLFEELVPNLRLPNNYFDDNKNYDPFITLLQNRIECKRFNLTPDNSNIHPYFLPHTEGIQKQVGSTLLELSQIFDDKVEEVVKPKRAYPFQPETFKAKK